MLASTAVQTAVYAALQAVPELANKVYDGVPKDTAFPYVRIGDYVFEEQDDAYTVPIRRVEMQVTIFDSYGGTTGRYGSDRILTLADKVVDTLHRADLVLQGGWKCAWSRLESSNRYEDPVDETRNIAITFSFFVSK